MSKYHINENLVKKSTRDLFIAYAPSGIILSALIAVPLLVMLNDGRIGSWTIAVPFFLLVFGLQMVRLIRRQQALMKSYFLEITDAGINRWTINNPPLSIESMEIIAIIKFKNGGFLVKGQDGKQIMIPQVLDGPGNLEQQLLALGPITTGMKDPSNLRYRWFMLLLTAAIYFCLIIAKNKIVIAIAALLALGQIGFVLYQIWKFKNLRYASTRALWFHVILLGLGLFLALLKLVPDPAFTPVKSHRSANIPSSNRRPNPAVGSLPLA
jgi:hypothetical protein